MTKFVKFKLCRSKYDIYINPEHVVAAQFRGVDDETSIHTTDRQFVIVEGTPSDVVAALEKSSQ